MQQAMLRSAGPKWGRGVMPDQSQAQDLEDLLNVPDAALHKLTLVGRCRFTVSESVLKAPMISALETITS